LKNIGNQADKKIEDYGTTLLEHHKAFMDEAAVVTEITALQILDDVGVISAKVGIISAEVGLASAKVGAISAKLGIISADVGRISSQLDGMVAQLEWVSIHASDAGTSS
jgi:hypothetical protein